MQLKPFKQLIAMSKDAFNEMLLPVRTRKAKSQAETRIAEYEERMMNLEIAINSKLVEDNVNFDEVADMIDEYDLIERRINTFKQIVSQLFGETVQSGLDNSAS
jgi:hypothetical protein